MAPKVHVWALGGVKAEHVRIYLAEIDPDLLSILALVNLLILVLVEANLGPVHIECDDSCVRIARSVEANRLIFGLFSGVIGDVSSPVDPFALVVMIIVIVAFFVFIRIK